MTLVWGFAVAWVSVGWADVADQAPRRIVVSTGRISRELVIEEGRLRTEAIVLTDGRRLELADSSVEFRINDDLTSNDYQVESASEGDNLASATFVLRPTRPEFPDVTIVYEADPQADVLRKSLRVERGIDGETFISQLAVESWDEIESAELGGLGQPLYLDRTWFVGVEHPASQQSIWQGELRCERMASDPSSVSASSVIGATKGDETIEDAFLAYVETIRPARRSFLMHSGWFDHRGGDVNPETTRKSFATLQAKLLEPFNLKLDAMLVDDGYQNPDSLWEPNDRWPGGFKPVSEELSRAGSALGVWLPLNGLGLDIHWGQDQGWQTCQYRRKRFYDLTDPRYQAALKRVVQARLTEDGVSCLKHDFNVFDVDGRSEALIRTAIADATIDMLDWERTQKPGVFLSLTTGVWLSPWWLMHADAIFLGYADYDHDWSRPTTGDRAAELTYRDEKMYRQLRVSRVAVPISSIMTHGIIRGRLDGTDPPETLEEWSDYVVMTLGRGTELQELYVSADRMPADFWPVLGKAIRWAQAHREAFGHSTMIGGHSGRGEWYGYAHWAKTSGVVVVRNPGLTPQEVVLDASHRPANWPEVADWQPVTVYPQGRLHARMPATGQLRLTLPGGTVSVVHFYASPTEGLRDLPVGPFAIKPDRWIVQSSARPIVLDRTHVTDEKEWWLGLTSWDGLPRDTGRIRFSLSPAGGAFWNSKASDGSVFPVVRHRDVPSAWEVQTLRMYATQADLYVAVPPTPLWPERTRLTAVIECDAARQVLREVPMDSKTPMPDWPMVLAPDVDRLQMVFVDDKELYRGRRWYERAVWVALLLGVPFTLAEGFTRWISRRRTWWQAMGLRFLIGINLALLYVGTPMGTWLVRALGLM
jgi:hypothetical protein